MCVVGGFFIFLWHDAQDNILQDLLDLDDIEVLIFEFYILGHTVLEFVIIIIWPLWKTPAPRWLNLPC